MVSRQVSRNLVTILFFIGINHSYHFYWSNYKLNFIIFNFELKSYQASDKLATFLIIRYIECVISPYQG